MPKHYLIFVHGIGERQSNQRSQVAHKQAEKEQINSYTTLWNNLAQAYAQTSNGAFGDRFVPIYTDWHTEQIHLAQATIYNEAFPDLAKQKISLFRPLRNFATFFVGDVIAYVSEDVNVIRRTVWQQIWQQIKEPLKHEQATYSIISHSLGTVIMFDYLFKLLRDDELFVTELNPEMEISLEDKRLLKERFCHFFTLGSPIGLFMLRQGSLWDNNDPFRAVYNPIRGNGHVWLNFYDRKDLIAYPLQNLFNHNPENEGCQLEDKPVWAGFTSLGAHTNYWKNRELAGAIAKTLVETKPLSAETGASTIMLPA